MLIQPLSVSRGRSRQTGTGLDAGLGLARLGSWPLTGQVVFHFCFRFHKISLLSVPLQEEKRQGETERERQWGDISMFLRRHATIESVVNFIIFAATFAAAAVAAFATAGVVCPAATFGGHLAAASDFRH